MSDIKVIRYLDGYEKSMTQTLIVLCSELTVSEGTNAYEKLKKDLPAQLAKFQCTRLSIQNISTSPQFIEAYKAPQITPVEWASAAPAGAVESIRVPEIGSEWEEGSPLLAVCIAQRNNDVQLTVKAAHTIADS